MERTNGFVRTLIGRVIYLSIFLCILLLAGSVPAVGQTVCAQDQTMADFILGTTDANTALSLEGDGEVILTPALKEEFSGPTLGTGWGSFTYSGGTSPGFASGNVVLNGARIYSSATYGPGSILEFVATFTLNQYQFMGFAIASDIGTTYVFIGRGSQDPTDGNLYLRRPGVADSPLGTGLLGSPHRFKIKWNASDFDFYVDDEVTPRATMPYPVGSNMVILASDYNSGVGTELSVDWLRVTPYTVSGTFTSRVFDASQVVQWQDAIWNEAIPTGTSLDIFVRTGNTSTPDGTWASFTRIAGSGTNLGMESRYIQYQAVFATTNNIFSPVLEDISFACNGEPSTPVVTEHPASQTACENTTVVFESHATGFPPPAVQWEVSVDGLTWVPIVGATSSQLSFNALLADNGNQYHAVWTTGGSSTATSNAATLTINPAPEGELSPLRNPIVAGEDFDLVFNSTSTGPFTLVINEIEYPNIISGTPFTVGTASEIPAPVSFWPESQTVVSENTTTDNGITELGLRIESSISGSISAIKIYKVGASTPTFTVSLWDRANLTEPLATTTYECDATEGWKVITFLEPIAIEANKEYVASYFSNISYYYAYTLLGGFPRTSGSLYSPGVCYRDPLTPRGPWVEWTANYWVDVVFTSFADFKLTSIADANNCTTTGDPISTASFEIQAGNLWTGGAVADPDWSNNLNWVNGIVPGAGETVVIPEVTTHYPLITGNVTIDNLTVRPLAALTVNGGGTLTVNGDLITTGADFEINSGSTTSSGSLIVNGTATGNVTYNRFMPTGTEETLYRYISLPVSSTTFPAGSFWRWDEVNGRWGEDQAEAVTTEGASGIGYTVAATGTSLAFTGTVLTGPVNISATAPYDATHIYQEQRTPWGGGGWNLLGNPYPSAIRGYNNDGISDNDFITHNQESFDPNYWAIYIYNGANYYFIAASTPGYPDLGQFPGSDVQAGQGFFVLAKYNNVPFEFTPAMRTHNTVAEMMKSAPAPWPGLQLKVKYGETETATLVVYKDGMSTGLDAGYDIGHLSPGAEIELYTHLAGGGSDFNFTRQALPSDMAGTTAVPVGLDFASGGEVTFSAYTIPLEGSRFWLEDKVTGTITDLNTKSYTVTLPANSFGTGRFYIIASANSPTDVELPGADNGGLKIWNSGGRVIIQGEVSEGSLCEIYTMNGSMIAETRFAGGEMNSIALPAGSRGMLIVKVTDGPKVVTRKIAVPGK